MTRTADADERQRLTAPLLLALVCAFSFGAIVRIALADVNYHVNCVGHGFVHSTNLNDGSFFARVESGCSSTMRSCDLYSFGRHIGGQTVIGSSAGCNAWSFDYGDYAECASTAHVYAAGVFASHVHKAVNWCGG